MSNLPRRHFLSWDRPLLPQAVRFLAGDWQGPAPLDLSRVLVVVPTRESGRRLREALAEYAGTHGTAAFPPRVMTPEVLVASAETAVASRTDNLVAWIDVFRGIDLPAFREVFPVDPPTRNFAWSLRLAEQFTKLQSALAEGGLRIGDVVTKLDPAFPEYERWVQLADLDRLQRERLRRAGLESPFMVAIEASRTPEWARYVDRVVFLATPDPILSAVFAAETCAARVAVEVVVYAPESEGAHFDAWGRPIVAAWKSRPLVLPDFEGRVHLCADPADQAAKVASLAAEYRDAAHAAERSAGARSSDASQDHILAVGIADPALSPLLAGTLARVGVTTFSPEGRVRRNGALYHLLEALMEIGRAPSFEAVEALARCPDFLSYLGAELGPEFSAARFLASLDELRQRHMPADLSTAKVHAAALSRAALELMTHVGDRLREGEFPENVAAVLGSIFGGRRLDLTRQADVEVEDAAKAWMDFSRQCAEAARRFPDVASAEWWELALRLYGESRRSDDKPADAIELQGWLELLFEDAPHLVITGLNDGFVPEAITEDAFLPESLRALLGLKTNAARFARDAYLLAAISAPRTEKGRLDVLFGKTSSVGDPLRPSRLLLQCADEELPERVRLLFRPAEPSESHLPWTRTWQLRPRHEPPPTQIAVTALRRWLECPFRFYLKYVLRMETVDATKSEMDAFDFGTLSHSALEAMGRDPALRDCMDSAVLRDFLWAELNRHAHARYGGQLPLPLLIQVESARQRLGKLADLQARERADGWITEAVERPFIVGVNGLTVRGKIDRIDRNERTGAVRVLDYKTSDTGVTPAAAHVRSIRGGEVRPDWAKVMIDGRMRAWADLQLPLYREALTAEWGSNIACGYINLPKAIGETALHLWEDYSAELHASAMECAQGVCGAIRAGEFWPPNEDLRAETDEFAPLFHRGVAESVEWRQP